MKKIFFLILFLVVNISKAQDYYSELNSEVYTATQIVGGNNISSPDVEAFQKVHMVPVSNYTGRINLSIPFYEIKVGNISIPISLSYNSSGVKVNDMASNVGLNWSLNAGGVISKITKGIDDFKAPLLTGTIRYHRPSGILSYVNYPDNMITLAEHNDVEADIFQATAPGLNTSYIHENPYFKVGNINHVSTNLPQVIELEPKGNLITEYPISRTTGNVRANFSKIEITSIAGIKYSFMDNEKVYSNSQECSRDYCDGTSYVSSFMLNEMYDYATDQNVTFEYEEYSVGLVDEIKQPKAWYSGSSTVRMINYNSLPKPTSKTTYPKRQRLKKIVFEDGTVEFEYNLNRQDNPYEKALTDIIIKDSGQNIIKRFKLEYSYFMSNVNSNTPQGKRLRLDKVFELDKNNNSLPPYLLDYYYESPIPPRDSYAHDFLGYNNGSFNISNSTPVPNMYLTYNSSDINVSPFYDVSAILLPGNFSLESNESFAKTYTLKGVKFPLGGSNHYEYELNEFNYRGENIKGAGLRIKTQTLYDSKGNQQIIDYTYGTGHIGNFPKYAMFEGIYPPIGLNTLQDLRSYIEIYTFSAPNSQVELTQGSFVGYSEVIEKNRLANNGEKQMFYSNWGIDRYENIKANAFIPELESATPTANYPNLHESFFKLNKPSYTVNRSFLRGRLVSELYLDEDGSTRLEKRYKYILENFNNIQFNLLNIGNPDLNYRDDCYFNEDGKYYYKKRVCPSYIEEVNIPIDRYLLTEVVTNDYEKGRVTDTDERLYLENSPYTFRTKTMYSYDSKLPLLLSEIRKVEEVFTRIDNQVELTGTHLDLLQLDQNQRNRLQNLSILRNEQGEDLYLSEAIDVLGLLLVDLPLQIKQELNIENIQQISAHPIVSKEIEYPKTNGIVNSLPMSNQLITQNRMATPLRIQSKSNGNLVTAENHYYKQFDNILALEKIDFLDRNQNITDSDKITKRDNKGRVQEYLKKDGIYVSRIYGYSNLAYLVAEVENQRYDDIITILESSNIQTPFNTSTLNSDSSLRQLMNELRTYLKTQNIDARVTSYTHQPHVGVTSITDPRLQTIYYQYDNHHRLKYVKDNEGNVLKENTYNFIDNTFDVVNNITQVSYLDINSNEFDRVTKRHSSGNQVLEYLREDGTYVSLFYGYDYGQGIDASDKVVIKVHNMKYDDLQFAIQSLIEPNNSFGLNLLRPYHNLTFSSDDELIHLSNLLRTYIVNEIQGSENIEVTSYTHDTIIGLTSVTNSEGVTMYTND